MNTIIKAGSDLHWKKNTMHITGHFNMDCNFKCSYCIVDTFRKTFNNQLSPTALYNLFSSLPLLKKDFYTFNISGGEPSLYTYFPQVLNYMKEFIPANKLRATWMTNGSLLHKLEEYFKDYRAYDFNLTITLHLEQMNAETYLKKLSEFKYPDMCTIKIMLEPGTLKQIDSIIEKIKNFGYKKFNVQPVIISQKLHPNYTNEEMDFIKNSAYGPKLILFNEYLRKNKTIKKEFTQDEFNINPELINYKGLKCLAGYNSMRILPDGTITSCLETQRIPNFNLDNDTLLDYAYTPITCPSTWCNCIVYTRLPKWNPQHTECPTYFKNNSQ